jgi:hypothetical protein
MSEIDVGNRVEAIVDRQAYKKGDKGTCCQVGMIDSELYISVKFDNGTSVGPVLADSFIARD